MKLRDLENIIRPNFLWDKQPHRRWHVVSRTASNKTGTQSDETTLGFIVFCGVAHQCGFNDKDVANYLEIKREKFVVYLSKFKKAHQDAAMSEINKIYEDNSPIALRVAAKTKIVMNAIRLHHRNQQFVSMSDMDF